MSDILTAFKVIYPILFDSFRTQMKLAEEEFAQSYPLMNPLFHSLSSTEALLDIAKEADSNLTVILESLSSKKEDKTMSKRFLHQVVLGLSGILVNRSLWYRTSEPTTMNNFSSVMEELCILFAKKQMDYGSDNIGMKGNSWLAKLAVAIRSNDKAQRLINLLSSNSKPHNESIEDSYKDMAVYGLIALILLEDKWGKDK